jgi:DNA-binding NtrC family response regulator
MGIEEPDHHATLPLSRRKDVPTSVRRFRLTTLEGPKKGEAWESTSDRCAIGSHGLNDLIFEEETVSRFHCEIQVAAEGVLVKDLDSVNGVILDGVQVKEAFLRGGSVLRLGRVVLRFDLGVERNVLAVADSTRFGPLVGRSVAMRTSFAMMERAASSDATVLLEGETGIGKSRAARAIHEASPRKDGPFIVVDCGAIPANLLESELFGHEKGAFTGAANRRVGAFEEANGGTVFIDEIGELPSELQPKLLRVLEDREIRRLGSNQHLPVNVRVIAATHRDLRAEVNAGRFRSDLFFRLAVLRIALPSLRQRPEDLPDIVQQLLNALGANADTSSPLRAPEFIARLQQFAWPGNVRELRNYLERCLVFEDAAVPLGEEVDEDAPASALVDARLSYADARKRALEVFERGYVQALLQLHQGKVSQAAAAADIDRVYLYRLLRRHGLKT